jgi:hypothetical protein
MFSKSARAIYKANRQLFSSWKTCGLFVAVYAALLVTLYVFVSTREATVTQLGISLTLAVTAPMLFFVLQAASATYTSDIGAGFVLKRSVKEFWKLAAVSLPVVAIMMLALYLLGKAQTHIGISASVGPTPLSAGQTARQPLQSSLILLTTLKYLLLGVVAPLVLIQLWITVSNYGIRSLLSRFSKVVSSAFSPETLLIYAVGFLLFAVIPYFVLFRSITSQRAWVEITALTLRLVASAALLLVGWVTTVGALTIAATQPALEEP